jgi:hypothetical protein
MVGTINGKNVPWRGCCIGRVVMTAIGKNRNNVIPVLFLCLGLGAVIGAAWALRLDEEKRRIIKKNLFELREMPYRVLV